MSSIKEPANCLWIGKRKTGKSFCIRDFLWHHQDIPVCTVISGSEDSNEFYKELVPPVLIHPDYTPEIIENVLERQQRVIEKKQRKPEQYATMDPRQILIMDDLMHNVSTWIKDKNIRYISMNGRHKKMFWLLTMQYVFGIPPAFRTNIDYVFIMRENIHQNKKRLYDAFCGMFPSLDVFSMVLDRVTENFGCMVIVNCSRSNKLTDQVFWYRAKPRPSFRLCSPIVWAHQQRVGKKTYDDDDKAERMTSQDEFSRLRNKKTPAFSLQLSADSTATHSGTGATHGGTGATHGITSTAIVPYMSSARPLLTPVQPALLSKPLQLSDLRKL